MAVTEFVRQLLAYGFPGYFVGSCLLFVSLVLLVQTTRTVHLFWTTRKARR